MKVAWRTSEEVLEMGSGNVENIKRNLKGCNLPRKFLESPFRRALCNPPLRAIRNDIWERNGERGRGGNKGGK